MALQVKAGTFVRGTASVTGLGFTPVAIIFLASHNTASGTWANDARWAMGFWANNGSNAKANCVSFASAQGVATTNAWTHASASYPLELAQPGGGNDWRIASVTAVAGGFNLTYGGNNGSQIIHYLAIGGGPEVKADILRWSSPASAATGTQALVSGLGFRPQTMIHLGWTTDADANNKSARCSVGVTDSANRSWVLGAYSVDNAGTSATARGLYTDAAAMAPLASGTPQRVGVAGARQGGFVSSVVASGAFGVNVATLCLDGVLSHVGTQAKATGGAPAAQAVGVPFTPLGHLFGSGWHTASDALASGARGSIGVADSSYSGGVAFNDKNAVGSTVSETVSNTTRALTKANNDTRTVEAAGNVTADGPTGYTATWQTNDAVNAPWGHLVIGTATHLLGSANPFVAVVTGRPKLGSNNALSGHPVLRHYAGGALGAIQPVDGAVLTSFTTTGRLSLRAALVGNATVRVVAAAARLRLNQPLAGNATWRVYGGSGGIGPSQPLAGSVPIRILGSGQLRGPNNLRGGTALGWFPASLLIGVDIPIVADAAGTDLVGTVNLVRNPSLESVAYATLDWSGASGCTVTQDTAHAWHGGYAAKGVFAASQNGAAMTVVTQRGIGWTAIQRSLIGSVRVWTADTGLEALLRVVYTDATTVDGAPSTVAPGPDFQAIVPESVALDTTKALDYAALVVRRPSATGSAVTAWADGAQVEEDRGAGATPFAIGAYGLPYHRWAGVPHLSMSAREPIPATRASTGRGGFVTITAEMWRVDANNTRKGVISGSVVKASVTLDTSRDVAWTLDCLMTKTGYDALTPWEDWLAPVMTVAYPDGTVRTGQLGHFLLLPSSVVHNEHFATVEVQGRSPEWLLATQGYENTLTVAADTPKLEAVRQILRGSGLRFDLPDLGGGDKGSRLRRRSSWETSSSKLDICNELLESAGYLPLWSTPEGRLTSMAAKGRRYRKRQPARVWLANVPDTAAGDISPKWPRVASVASEVVGSVRLNRNLSQADNEIVVVSSDPRSPRLKVKRHINHPENPASTQATKKVSKRTCQRRMIDESATADEVAETIAENISTKIDTVDLSVLPDPAPDLANEVVYLAIYSMRQEPVAVGRYRVLSVTYGFTPEEALMLMKVGLVHRSDQLDGGALGVA